MCGVCGFKLWGSMEVIGGDFWIENGSEEHSNRHRSVVRCIFFKSEKPTRLRVTFYNPDAVAHRCNPTP